MTTSARIFINSFHRASALALSASALASAAYAQSGVTIYGIADAYGQYLDGASRTARLQSGGLSGSRLGFRGSEDLGDGFKAIFTLEMGINLDSGTLGQGGAAFGRQAFVGLADSWGELTLGRQLGSLHEFAVGFSPFGISSSGPSARTIGGFAGGYEPFRDAVSSSSPSTSAGGSSSPVRIDNAIRYASPTWNGLRGTALVGLGEVSGNTKGNRVYDLSLRYAFLPLDLYALYVNDKSESATSPGDVTTVGVGGTYRLGAYKLYAAAVSVNDKGPINQDGRGYWLGAQYTRGAHLIRGAWLQNKPRFDSDNKTSALGLGYQYNLSKRTALYTSLTKFTNGSRAGTNGAGRFNAPVPVGLTQAGDNDVSELVAGILHTF